MSFYKNGRVTTNYLSNDYPIMDMEIKILEDNSIWARILHHNNRSGTVMFTSSNVMNIQTEDLYSRLYLLENFRDNDNNFEFLVIQPEFGETYYRWKQLNNPTTNNVLENYVNISNTTVGLAHTNNNTLMSKADSASDWWLAVGCYNSYQNGVPGFGNKVVKESLDFYVRINDIKRLDKFSIYKKNIISTNFYEN